MNLAALVDKLVPQRIKPNHITGLRLFLIIPIIICLWMKLWALFIALYLFALASDYIDGVIARKRGHVTKFGAVFDPVVDKLLHIVLLAFLLPFAPFLIGAIILLDLIILSGGWIVIHHYNKTKKALPIKGAHLFGKLKVVFQGLLIILLYCFMIFPQTIAAWPAALIIILLVILFSALTIIRYALDLMRAR